MESEVAFFCVCAYVAAKGQPKMEIKCGVRWKGERIGGRGRKATRQ
jgi:hypothetical protein